jgi:hypothetical protein
VVVRDLRSLRSCPSRPVERQQPVFDPGGDSLHYEQATSSATLNVPPGSGGLSRVFILQSLDLVSRASEEAAAVPVVSKSEMGVRLRVRERMGDLTRVTPTSRPTR